MPTVKPIRSAEDLRIAHDRLATLIVGNSDSQYDDEIEVLATLIEHYERTNIQIEAPAPVAAIRFRMSEMGLSPRQLEPYIGSRARVSEILSGKRSLSIDMIRSLHDGLGIPYASLIARPKSNELRVPPPALARLNSLGFDVDRTNLRSFMQTSATLETTPALLRKTRSSRAAAKTDQASLLLWQAAVLSVAAKTKGLKAFDATHLDDKYLRGIARLSCKSEGPALAIGKLAEIGVHVIIMPSLPGTFLDGAAMLAAEAKAIIALTLRYDRTDNFWFTLMHELAHLRLHFEDLKKKDFVFFDDMDIHSEDIKERQADDLAQQTLIPDSIIRSVHWGASSSSDEIIAVSTRARVHLSVVAGRWQRDNQNYRKFARMIERNKLRPMFIPHHK